jgi:hypothetical protein
LTNATLQRGGEEFAGLKVEFSITISLEILPSIENVPAKSIWRQLHFSKDVREIAAVVANTKLL